MKCQNETCKADALGWCTLKAGGSTQVNHCAEHLHPDYLKRIAVKAPGEGEAKSDPKARSSAGSK